MPEEPELDSIEFKQNLLGMQLVSLAWVGACAVVWAIVNHWWPDFFTPFKWSHKSPDVAASLLCFWPMFAYAGFMALLSCSSLTDRVLRFTSAEEHLTYDTITSVLAGLWEELGYRCVFILTAMIGITLSNYIWSWLILVFVVCGVVIVLGKLAGSKGSGGVMLAVIGVGIYVIVATWNMHDPVFWIYQHVIFPILHFVSFGYVDPILHFEGAPVLFIMGAVSANAKFRDGHKYQGLFGWCNAWVIGFVLLYAMLYHGLLVAILAHAIYDVEFALIRYLGRKAIA